MVRHGEYPFLECSTRGDKRFSALCARVQARGGQTIEELYQGAKIFPNGATGLPWRLAKGRKPLNAEEVARLYHQLWVEYLIENPSLIEVLAAATGLSDIFGQTGSQCQASVLWKLRNEYIDLLGSDVDSLSESEP